MKLVALRKEDQNEAWVDPWSAVHGSAGLAFGLVNVPFKYTFVTAIVWDIFEHFFEKSRFGQRFFKTSGPESFGNVASDTVLFLFGWYLGQKYNSTGPAVNPSLKPPPRSKKRNPGRILRTRKGQKPTRGSEEPRGMRQRADSPYPSLRNSIAGSIEPIDFGLRRK